MADETQSSMTAARAIELIRASLAGQREFNRLRELEDFPPLDLRGLRFGGMAMLDGINLRRTQLSEVSLFDCYLREADLSGAILERACLAQARLNLANLSGADLIEANLSEARLYGSDLSRADLSDARLYGAQLNGARLTEAELLRANFTRADLAMADLAEATTLHTTFGDVDLSDVRGLQTINQLGPSSIGEDTLRRSKGRIPATFLKGAGLPDWQIEASRLYDPTLTAREVERIQYRVFDLRTNAPFFLGGVFFSYSHADSDVVERLETRLDESGARTWRDAHDMVAGPMERQVFDAIRVNDAVVIVLSETSVRSDWVEHELELGRNREREENRDVLCPSRSTMPGSRSPASSGRSCAETRASSTSPPGKTTRRSTSSSTSSSRG
jgi:uncharacterized protein YjbI with pentapeptide repeats